MFWPKNLERINPMTDTTDIAALRERLQSAISQHEMMMGCVMGLSRVDPMYQQCLDALNDLEAERQRADAAHKYGSERDAENESLMLTVGRLRKEIAALKSAHGNMVARCALLRQRTDLPVDRIPAYNSLVKAQEEVTELREKLANPVVLPARFKPEVSKVDVFKGSPVMKLDATGGWLNRTGVIVAINAAGFTVKGE